MDYQLRVKYVVSESGELPTVQDRRTADTEERAVRDFLADLRTQRDIVYFDSGEGEWRIIPIEKILTIVVNVNEITSE